MSRLVNLRVILATVALSCWPAAGRAGPPEHPYRDSVSGEVTELDTSNFPAVYQEYEATGKSNPFGPIGIAGSHILTFDPPPGPGEEGAHGSVVGQFTTTTRDGSTISGAYSGAFVRVEGVVLFALHVEFGEGTGRLEGVTGEAVTFVTASGPSEGDSFTWISKGFLSFP